jgi:hypothetical protein
VDEPEPSIGPTDEGPVFLVEAYRSRAPVGDATAVVVAPEAIVGVIDIPRDEVILYLVQAPDGGSAERLIRDRGGRPIRVVDVRWSPPAR